MSLPISGSQMGDEPGGDSPAARLFCDSAAESIDTVKGHHARRAKHG